MGRSKVPESARRRAAVACVQCRMHKKKCSATQPCGQCVRRGLGAVCSFAGAGESSALKVGGSGLGHSLGLGLGLGLPGARPASPSPSQSRSSVAESHITGELQPQPRPRLLFNRRGEQVFIGQAASLSFLQLAREIVATRIGPSSFSHNRQIQTMLETASPPPETAAEASPEAAAAAAAGAAPSPAASVPPAVTLDVEQMLAYARICIAAMDGFMDLFAPSEVESLLAGAHAADVRFRNPYKQATAYLVVAVGAQCASPASAADVGVPFFRHAQHLAVASEAALEDPSADMVRAFLLMAFYMLGHCRRNAAFMYLGVAARAAVVLGMHSPDAYGNMALPRFRLRLRIWLSLCNLDMAVAAILGRPAATAGLRAALDRDRRIIPSPAPSPGPSADPAPGPGSGLGSGPGTGPDSGPGSGPDAGSSGPGGPGNDQAAPTPADDDLGVLMASYSILGICNDIVDHLYGRRAVPSALVEQYLDAIEAWKGAYGAQLAAADRLNTIGHIHVSCLYYFAVTLVTRPVLIRALTQRAPARIRPAWAQMAHACVDAAIGLVQTCVDGHEAGQFLGNMCILKAFLFVAGLILGLRSFMHQQMIDHEVEVAFVGACHSLEWLAVQSPQAAHYLEILRLLRAAIKKQRQGLQRRAVKARYVDRPPSHGYGSALGGGGGGDTGPAPAHASNADSTEDPPAPSMPDPGVPDPAPEQPPHEQTAAAAAVAAAAAASADESRWMGEAAAAAAAAPGGTDWPSPLQSFGGSTAAPELWPPADHREDEIQFHWDRLDLSQWDDFLEPRAGGLGTSATMDSDLVN